MVTVYGRSNCAQCTATTRTLEIKDVVHVYVDVELHPDACDFLRSLGHQQLPVVIAGPVHWSGFRPDLIVALARTKVSIN